MTLRGTNKSIMHWMIGRQSTRIQCNEITLCVYPNAMLNVLNANSSPKENASMWEPMLSEYADVFAVPTTLPPQRTHDHKIPLIEGTLPVNIRPYRHPPTQKDAIELMVKELLDAGLNKHTIKDKFPVPIIEELIDELHGSMIFSKLDLRFGYHQIRMYEDGIAKTAFKTHEGHYEFLVMPFGLTNAPSTFQSLMNEVFRQFMRKFTLVFFDDILVYSPTEASHEEHLRTVLHTLRDHKLYAKKSKCIFGSNHMKYIGHIISDKGVATDPAKIKVMQNWPIPKSLKQLRGFLGIIGYYRRFVRDYAIISQPLTALLKKNAFKWCANAQTAFEDLKKAMIRLGIGAVLQQNGHPIAFMSKILSPKHQSLSTYEKEFLAVIQDLDRCRGYILNRHFIIKTDHFSLRYLMDQRVTTPAQVKWLPKLIGSDYEIRYKKGTENVVADALSRLSNIGECLQMVATNLTTDVYQKIVKGWVTDNKLREIVQKLQPGNSTVKHYQWSAQQLLRKGKLIIGDDSQFRQELFKHFHEGSQGKHSGVQATLKRMRAQVYWKEIRKEVKERVRTCTVCQRFKPELVPYSGLLQPLPIPEKVWTHISIDFVDGLPMSKGKSVLMVVVDRLSKYGHFIPLTHPYSTITVAQAFLDNVYKLHGLPNVIVSDRDTVFLSRFWSELFKMLQVNLHMSSAYHPHTDGQTEVVNRCVECYLRCMTRDKPKEWVQWIPLAEYWYNTSFHTLINTTPYQVLYGQAPPAHVTYTARDSANDSVDMSLVARETAIQLLKFHLQRAHDRMKTIADKKRTERVFGITDLVLLKLQPYRQSTLKHHKHHKLAPKYYGPFKIVAKVGEVAYKLELLEDSQIHPMFHVSQLKKFRGTVSQVSSVLPHCDSTSVIALEPIAILDRRMAKKGNVAAVYVLIQWTNEGVDDATWELYDDIVVRFPHLTLMHELLVVKQNLKEALI
ncbi:retrotransposon-related protein [Tanacetum coccineum]